MYIRKYGQCSTIFTRGSNRRIGASRREGKPTYQNIITFTMTPGPGMFYIVEKCYRHAFFRSGYGNHIRRIPWEMTQALSLGNSLYFLLRVQSC